MANCDKKSDHRGLKKLDVYGDLLEFYKLPVRATIIEVGKLYQELQALETRILTLYTSYVLAHSGFNVEVWTSKDFVEGSGEALYTTEFQDADWIENLDLFEPLEQVAGFYPHWEMYYKNGRQERLKIIFVASFMIEIDALTGTELNEVEYLLKKFDRSCSNYVLIDPKLSRQNKKAFKQAKEKMKQYEGDDLILSTGEFTVKFIHDNEKRHIIEANWKSLREKIVENLQKKWPILIFSTNAKQLSDVDERIRNSRIKYETNSFEDAIKDAGVACEGLLQILHSVYLSKKTAEKLEFYDLLCALEEVIAGEFGSNIYRDLDFIRTWRNNVVHPGREKPDGTITLQVITRARLFNELFKKKILATH